METTNTYTQLYVQFVFAVKYRSGLIQIDWEEQLHKFITSIVQNRKNKLLAINSASDHLHLLVGLNPNQSCSALMEQVKGKSSLFINEKKFTKNRFRWQEGFGVFSYSKSQVDYVVKYILNQKEHHKKMSFIEEYIDLLKEFGIVYDERYIFHEPIDD